jgi:hypothetical protein
MTVVSIEAEVLINACFKEGLLWKSSRRHRGVDGFVAKIFIKEDPCCGKSNLKVMWNYNSQALDSLF